MSEWISVKDRLPKQGEDVLVFGRGIGFSGGGEIRLGKHWDYDGGYESHWTAGEAEFLTHDTHDVEVTHWMPLPEPPSINT